MKKIMTIAVYFSIAISSNIVHAADASLRNFSFRAYCPIEIYCGRDDDLFSCHPINDDAGGYITNIGVVFFSTVLGHGIYKFDSAKTTKYGSTTDRVYCTYTARDSYEPQYINSVTFENHSSVNFEAVFEPGAAWVGQALYEQDCVASSPTNCPFQEPAELYIKTAKGTGPLVLKAEINGQLIGENSGYLFVTNDIQSLCARRNECGIDISASGSSRGEKYYYPVGTIYFDPNDRMRVARIEITEKIVPITMMKHPTLNTVIVINRTKH